MAGRSRPIAQPTKQSFLYVFDRTNGQPVWPIVERPVPKGDVPGEWYSPTQPFPTKPPAYDRQGVTIDDLIDFTPELRAEAVQLVSKYKLGPLYTPPVMSKVEGPIGTLMLPSAGGGSNWAGGSYDPETHRLYVYSQTTPSSLGLVPAPPNNDFGLVSGNAATAAARGGRGRSRRCRSRSRSRRACRRPRRSSRAGSRAFAGDGCHGGSR